jgi:hypothetical protein
MRASRNQLLHGARTGLCLGTIVACGAAILVCGALGVTNEQGLTGADPEDSAPGLGEYTILGMVCFGMPICAILGGIAGTACGLIGVALRRPILSGLAAVFVGPLPLVLVSQLSGDGVEALFRQGPVAWALCITTGALVASIYCSRADLAGDN